MCPGAHSRWAAEPCLESGPASNPTAARINFLEANSSESQTSFPLPQPTLGVGGGTKLPQASNAAQTPLWKAVAPDLPSSYWQAPE